MAHEKNSELDTLIFTPVHTKKELESLINFDLEAFSALPDLEWTVKGLQKEIEDEWQILAISVQEEIVAVVLVKEKKGAWLTKTTSIKLAYQGNGFSHVIKEQLEILAIEQGLSEIRHYCPSDNFRLIALNERHGYKKKSTFKGKNGGDVEEWAKKLGHVHS